MVVLPDDAPAPPLEGALHLDPAEAGEGFVLSTVDYGRKTLLRTAPDEASAAQVLLAYLDQPLPPVAEFARADVDQAVNAASPHIADLVDRAPHESLLIQLPVGLALDRIGVLDGVRLFPYGTRFEARSLPRRRSGRAPSGTRCSRARHRVTPVDASPLSVPEPALQTIHQLSRLAAELRQRRPRPRNLRRSRLRPL